MENGLKLKKKGICLFLIIRKGKRQKNSYPKIMEDHGLRKMKII